MKKKNEGITDPILFHVSIKSGYLLVEGVKEYLKVFLLQRKSNPQLKNGDSKIPDHDPGFHAKFEKCWHSLHQLAKK